MAKAVSALTTGWRCTGRLWVLCGLLWLLAECGRVQAQPVINRLKSQLVSAKTDTSRCRLLIEIGREYNGKNVDSCLFFLHQSLQLATRTHNAFGRARAMCQLGYSYIYLLKDENRALSWLTKARLIALQSHDNLHLAKCYHLLATIAYHQHLNNAPEWMATALQYARKINNWEILSDIYGVSTDFSLSVRNYKQAKQYALQNMAVCELHSPDKWLTAGLDYCSILESQGNKAGAAAFARHLLSVKGKLRQTDGSFVYTNDMARLFTRLHRFKEAEAYLLKGLAVENQHGHPDSLHLYHYYETLVQLFAEQKKYEKAYLYSQDLSEIRLWLQRTRQTRDVKLQMTELKATLAMERQAGELALATARQQRQWLFLTAALLISALLAAFVFILHRKQQRIKQQHTELTQLNQTKDKLFAMLAHDLRAPFTSLSNNLTLMNWGALSPPEFASALPMLSTQLRNLESTLDNLLNWSLTQLGGVWVSPKSIDTRRVINDQIELLKPIIDTKGILVSNFIAGTARLLLDADHLAIIIRNLLQNAVKFTEPGGHIRFDYIPQGKFGRLEVSDNGIGIPQSQLASLFQLNSRASRRGTSNEGGSGLGLVLVHELVAANKGVIDVKSVPGQGTTFSLLFPACAIEPVADSDAVRAPLF